MIKPLHSLHGFNKTANLSGSASIPCSWNILETTQLSQLLKCPPHDASTQRQKARARNINKHSKMFLPAQLLLIWGVNTCTGKSPPHDINLLNNDPPVLPSKLSLVLGNQKLHNHHRPSRPTARVLNTKQGAASKPIALCLPQLKSAWTNTPNQHKHKQACYPVI